MRYVWFIAWKDLKIFTKDRMALIFSLLFPLFFATLFYFLLSGVGGEDKRLELHLVTAEAPGSTSDQIISGMVTADPAQLKPGEPLIIRDTDYNTAYQAVLDKKQAGFLFFPEDFTEGILMGYGAQIDVVTNADSTNTEAVLNGLAQQIAAQVSARQVASSAAIGLLVEKEIGSGNMAGISAALQQMLPQLYSGQQAPAASFITFDIKNIGEVKAENPSNYVIPGYLVMFVFFTAALGAEAIIRERQNNTLERMIASSVKKEAILGGIFTGTALKGIIQICIFWFFGFLVYRIDPGQSPGGVILLSLSMVIVSSAFSIMLATLVKTQRAAGSIGVLVSLILAPLGGCWWPLFITPRWMQFIAHFTPHGWATLGFNKLLVNGADFSAAIPNILVLLGFAVVFAVIGILRFRTSST